MPVSSNLSTSSVPRLTGRRSTPELLLDAAEALHASEATGRTLAKVLGEPSSRVRHALQELEREGLIRHAGGGPGRLARYTLTEAGAAALADRGRFLGDIVVLFTDLVASTQMIAEHGELGAHERRLRHFALLRKAVTRNGGHEVKGLGDGLMVAFADAHAAARCALDMQRTVGADADGLGLRVGMHRGPVLREGEDLHGSTVIAASRLCDRAESGEVLLSQAVADALEGTTGFGLSERGAQELKGLSVPVPTFALFDPNPERTRGGGSRSRTDRDRSTPAAPIA
ncbi:MAG: hypothetical protein J7513_06320 [Solirubrobacteraceae bacterium]|nr:hypothetical protein [Solirubrobacteraceae bacterium]